MKTYTSKDRITNLPIIGNVVTQQINIGIANNGLKILAIYPNLKILYT